MTEQDHNTDVIKNWDRESSLAGIVCTECDLTEVDLHSADLTEANFTDAKLLRADLAEATLTGATLTGADLWGANLENAVLDNATLDGSNLTAATLKSTSARQSSFIGVTLWETNLSDTDLTESSFANAEIQAADFRSANLLHARFDEAKLTNSRFDNSNLSEANFEHSHMHGVNLTDAILWQTNFAGVIGKIAEDVLANNYAEGCILSNGYVIEGTDGVKVLPPNKTYRTERSDSLLIVASGIAWVSISSIDTVVHAGESLELPSGKSIIISSPFDRKVVFVLK